MIAVALAAQAPLMRPAPMPALPLTQLDDRGPSSDFDKGTLSLTFAHPCPIQDLLLLLVRGTRLSIVADPSIGGTFIGDSEKPFSLKPDLKYLYRSQSHGQRIRPPGVRDQPAGRFRRRDRRHRHRQDHALPRPARADRSHHVHALVLNPFLTEEDLLKLILQDFGVVSRDDIKSARMQSATKQELIETLCEFLLSLIPRKAVAVLIIDEASVASLVVYSVAAVAVGLVVVAVLIAMLSPAPPVQPAVRTAMRPRARPGPSRLRLLGGQSSVRR